MWINELEIELYNTQLGGFIEQDFFQYVKLESFDDIIEANVHYGLDLLLWGKNFWYYPNTGSMREWGSNRTYAS